MGDPRTDGTLPFLIPHPEISTAQIVFDVTNNEFLKVQDWEYGGGISKPRIELEALRNKLLELPDFLGRLWGFWAEKEKMGIALDRDVEMVLAFMERNI
jgi:hypothetical protein